MNKTFTPWIANVKVLPFTVENGIGKYGIAADIDGVRKESKISADDGLRWVNAKVSDKPVVALALAFKAFRRQLAALQKKYGVSQPLEDMIRHFWSRSGRKHDLYEVEMSVYDRKFFKDEEPDIPFLVFDGFAVGSYEDKQYIMYYPTVREVKKNSAKYQQVENYCGQRVIDTGVCPEDVALTFGKIVYCV